MKKAGANCPTGWKECPYNICSNQKKDDKKTFVCPMTKATFKTPAATKANPNPATTIEVTKVQEKGTEYGPIVGFSAVQSSTSKSCLLPQHYIPYTDSKKNYPAFRIPQTGCGDMGKRIGEVKMDQETVKAFEDENGVTKAETALKYYKELMVDDQKGKYTLYSISKPQYKFDKKCNDHDSGAAGKIAENLDDFSNINYGFGITILVLCCLIILLGVALFLGIIK